MRNRSWTDWERWALETFFLEPGSHGPIECIEVTDEQIMSFVESDSLDVAATAFAHGIGPASLVVDWLSGSSPPPSHGRPRCFRVLIFACWAQVTSLRRSKNRVFQDILAEGLGLDARPGVEGLPLMWSAVGRWLWDEHRIDLRLPWSPYRRIGYTVNLSFPTWRDLQRLRNIRDAMSIDQLDSRRRVAERIERSNRDNWTPAFERKFTEWRHSVRIGDATVDRLAFDRAWTRVASEKTGVADLRLVEDEYGGLKLEIASRGAHMLASTPFAAADEGRLAPFVRRALRFGMVAFAPQGFGHWIATTDHSDATMAMVRPDMTRVSPTHADHGCPRVSPIGWSFLKLRPPDVSRPHEGEARSDARRIDGIRVGNALLGRTPMTPRWFVEPGDTCTLTIEGADVVPVRSGLALTIPEGVWSGTVQLRSVAGSRDAFRLSSEASEHDLGTLKAFDTIKAEPEDGPLFNTMPVAGGPRVVRYAAERFDPCGRMTALAEAVYARGAGSISMGDLVGLAGRAVEGAAHAPSPWDVLRSFVDGGWMEPGAVRRASARIFFPRSPRFTPAYEAGRRFLILDGMSGLALRDRVSASALAAGLNVTLLGGLSPWSLSMVVIGPTTVASENDLAARAMLPTVTEESPVSLPSKRWAVNRTTLGYDVVTPWKPSKERFDRETPIGEGLRLSRRERKEMDWPPIYVVGDDDDGEVIPSPVLAMLRYNERQGLCSFAADGRRLVRSAPRAFLPAAWGRWLSMRALTFGGPVRIGERWTYAYAADRAAVAALNGLCTVADIAERAWWGDSLANSRRNDIPSMVVAGRLNLNHHARPKSVP